MFQISSRDDITIDALVEESRRIAAKRLDLLGAASERWESREREVFPSPERYEWEGRRYTARRIPLCRRL